MYPKIKIGSAIPNPCTILAHPLMLLRLRHCLTDTINWELMQIIMFTIPIADDQNQRVSKFQSQIIPHHTSSCISLYGLMWSAIKELGWLLAS